MSVILRTIQPCSATAWHQMPGNRPRRESLYWIRYISGDTSRLAYWRDGGPMGPGFYAVTELHTPESQSRQVYRVEPSIYVTPDQWQPVAGEHSIEDIARA